MRQLATQMQSNPPLFRGSLRTKTRPCHQRTCPSRGLSTPRIPQSDLNASCQTQSPRSVSSSPAQSLAASRGVHVVSIKYNMSSCDTVRLEVVWCYSAKRSDGFTRLGWAGLTVIASLVSFAYWYFQCVACGLAQPTPSGPASGQREAFWWALPLWASPPMYGGLQAP